jgi:hypothetical protein
MPKKPNYNFEKRQKEIARQQKRDAKERERSARKESERARQEGETSSPLPQPTVETRSDVQPE